MKTALELAERLIKICREKGYDMPVEISNRRTGESVGNVAGAELNKMFGTPALVAGQKDADFISIEIDLI